MPKKDAEEEALWAYPILMLSFSDKFSMSIKLPVSFHYSDYASGDSVDLNTYLDQKWYF